LVADALRAVHAKQAQVKFLGSYPAAGEHGAAVREEVQASWRLADQWISRLRDQIS
jgi:prephenate dehydratase